MTAYDHGDPDSLAVLEARVLTQEPVPADAIVWLQGNRLDRGPKVLSLFRCGFAPAVVLTGNDIRRDEAFAIDGVHVMLADCTAWLTARGVPGAAIVVEDQSMHTRDQAVHVLDLAIARGWRTLLLVASPHHQLRAFLTFLRVVTETGWRGRLVNQPAEIAWDAIPSGRLRTTSECFTEEVEKLERYRGHVATLSDSLAYFQATC